MSNWAIGFFMLNVVLFAMNGVMLLKACEVFESCKTILHLVYDWLEELEARKNEIKQEG